MIEREARIVNPLGMHARPAPELVKVANRFQASVSIRRGDLAVNGKSIMGVMMLVAECGSSIHIKTDGRMPPRRWRPCLALVAAGFHEMDLSPEDTGEAAEEETA